MIFSKNLNLEKVYLHELSILFWWKFDKVKSAQRVYKMILKTIYYFC